MNQVLDPAERSTSTPRVLIVDDSETDAKLLRLALEAGFERPVECERVDTAAAMRDALIGKPWDAVVCDWAMPAFSALAALALVKELDLDPAFIIVSGTVGEETAVEGMRAGAHDYILKGNLTRLVPAIERELREKTVRSAQHFADAALAAVTDCAPAFILAVSEAGRMLFINRVLPQYSKSEVIGSDWLLYIAPEEHEQQRARLKRIIETGAFETYETTIVTPDNKTLCFSAHMGPMRLHGRVIGAVLVSLDVTELKQTQAEFAAAQRLAAGIAHEINTPIQFVSDSVHFLRGASRDTMSALEKLQNVRRLAEQGQHSAELARALTLASEAEEQADLEYLYVNVPQAFERCVDGLQRVSNIVRSMKEFAHPAQVEMRAVDLNRAVENTLTIARGEYKYVADLVTDFGELPPVVCHVDQINQVVLNLIVNAAHAIGDVVRDNNSRGTIRVQTRQEGDHAVISIGDTGGGIDDSIAHRIFDPFFTTKAVGKGTGQGLALAWSVVKDKHGGELKFTSAAGLGTTFFVRLPIAGKPGAASAEPS